MAYDPYWGELVVARERNVPVTDDVLYLLPLL